MEKLYVVIFCCAFGMTTELFDDLDEAKKYVERVKNITLGSINHFVPIKIVTGRENILHEIKQHLWVEDMYATGFLQESKDWREIIEDYIAYKNPFWQILKEDYEKTINVSNENEPVLNQLTTEELLDLEAPIWFEDEFDYEPIEEMLSSLS